MTPVQQTIINLTGITNYKEVRQDIALETCCFCGHSNYKLYIAPNGMYHCWVCGAKGGSLVSFLQRYQGLTYAQARQFVSTHNLTTISASSYDPHQHNIVDTLGSRFYHLTIDNNKHAPTLPTNTHSLLTDLYQPYARPFVKYFVKRKGNAQWLQQNDIRYCIKGIITFATGKTLTLQNSLVFVAHNKDGSLRYWNTRSIIPNPYVKSINASSNDDEYSKRDTVYNAEKLTPNNYAVWCEGVFNALTVTQDKYVGLATYGKQITDEQIDYVIAQQPQRHYIFLDNDAKDLAYQLVRRLANQGVPLSHIYMVVNPYGNQDANDLGQAVSYQLLQQAQPYLDNHTFCLENLKFLLEKH